MKEVAEKGDKVKIHYKGSLEDGTLFDSSEGREPIEFTIGDGQIIPGVEAAVEGMKIGEEKSVVCTPDEAYGHHVPELVKEVEKRFIPDDLTLEEGMNIKLGEGEESAIVTVTQINDHSVHLDANHPLAGKNLNFEITLVSVNENVS